MPNELIRPIDPETAKALAETAKALGKAVDLLSGTGTYASSVAGRLPHDLVGIVGDQLFHVRRMRALALDEAYLRRLRDRHVEPAEISPSVAIPLLEGAINETREVLKDLWERLLANAADPSRKSRVRLSFIENLKKFDPLDALVLQCFLDTPGELRPNARDFIAGKLQVSGSEVMVSFENLVGQGCLNAPTSYPYNPHLTERGRLLLSAVAP